MPVEGIIIVIKWEISKLAIHFRKKFLSAATGVSL